MEPFTEKVAKNREVLANSHPRSRKAKMTRGDWYVVYILSLFSGTEFFDGRRGWGMGLLIASILILILIDGFGINIHEGFASKRPASRSADKAYRGGRSPQASPPGLS